jgi:transposase InsO family protein
MTDLDQVFQRIGIDCCGPLFLTSKGNLHYVIVIDLFSKWLILIPVPNVKALTIAKAIYENVILTFGCPKEILSDNAKSFTANTFKETMEILGIKKIESTPYHHDGNAITERVIRECSDMIAKYLAEAEQSNEKLEWDDLLKEIALCHNVTKHSTIGMSPFFLMFGREPTLPIDVLLDSRKITRNDPASKEFREHLVQTIENARKIATENMREAMEEVKRQADKRSKESDINVGELVLYRDYRIRVGMSEKFKNPWLTVHRVKAIRGQHAWIVPRDHPENEPKRVHLNQVKKYYCEEERENIPPEPKTRGKNVRKLPKKPRDQAEMILNLPQRVVERTTLDGKKLRTLVYDEKGRARGIGAGR